MTAENSRILGRLVAMYEILKDKGLFTDEDIKNKLKFFEDKKEADAKRQLEEERKRLIQEKESQHNGDQKNTEADPVQPK